MPEQAIALDDFKALFRKHGGTDEKYLGHHFERFAQTKRRFTAQWDRRRGTRLLDIGAHWLHQSMLYAIDGFQVTALDLPLTLERPNVRALAQANSIRLLSNSDLENPISLREVPDNSFDIVLFTEIIEHLTFNPIAMWREIYRVLSPGARLVITTPNYYALRGRTWKWGRFLQRFGGGINVLDVLTRHTYGHHWKEYSLRELIYYFCVLSPDFMCLHPSHVEEYQAGYIGPAGAKIARWIERQVAILRPDVYLEVELARKDKGIVVVPHW